MAAGVAWAPAPKGAASSSLCARSHRRRARSGLMSSRAACLATLPGTGSERQFYGCGAALRRTVEHRLDIVAVRIDHESVIVVRMIFPYSGRAVVLAAAGQR